MKTLLRTLPLLALLALATMGLPEPYWCTDVDGIVFHRVDDNSVDIGARLKATTGRRSRFKKSRFTS